MLLVLTLSIEIYVRDYALLYRKIALRKDQLIFLHIKPTSLRISLPLSKNNHKQDSLEQAKLKLKIPSKLCKSNFINN